MGRRKVPAELPCASLAPVGDIVLLTRHGFGNRIRSVASAWLLASEVDRRLQLVWQTNESCGARLEDLFDFRPQTGATTTDSLCVNSLVALSCAAVYQAVERGAVSGDRDFLLCYEPYGNRCVLHSSDLAALTADPAPVVLLTGASVPATLHNRCPAQPARMEWNARPGSKAERLHAYEHGVDGRLRGAFYRALVPSVAVREVMAPVLERVAAERLAASEAGQRLVLVGVHVRQGDALDAKNGFFNHEPSAHDDVYVARFAAEMRALAGTCAAAGERALFFVASDQARARRQLREALGAATLVELVPEEEAPDGGGKAADDGGAGGGGADGGAEGRVRRDCCAVQHAVAEWLLLAQVVDVLIRSVRSSFSAEAALMHGVRCIDV